MYEKQMSLVMAFFVLSLLFLSMFGNPAQLDQPEYRKTMLVKFRAGVNDEKGSPS
jgi:hypothetical protein